MLHFLQTNIFDVTILYKMAVQKYYDCICAIIRQQLDLSGSFGQFNDEQIYNFETCSSNSYSQLERYPKNG